MTLFANDSELDARRDAAQALGGSTLAIDVVGMPADPGASNVAPWRNYQGGDRFAVLVRPDGRIAWVEPEVPTAVRCCAAP